MGKNKVDQYVCDRCAKVTYIGEGVVPDGWEVFERYGNDDKQDKRYWFCDNCVESFEKWRYVPIMNELSKD